MLAFVFDLPFNVVAGHGMRLRPRNPRRGLSPPCINYNIIRYAITLYKLHEDLHLHDVTYTRVQGVVESRVRVHK